MKNTDEKLSIEQIKLISNAIDINKIKEMIVENERAFNYFCLKEDFPKAVIRFGMFNFGQVLMYDKELADL